MYDNQSSSDFDDEDTPSKSNRTVILSVIAVVAVLAVALTIFFYVIPRSAKENRRHQQELLAQAVLSASHAIYSDDGDHFIPMSIRGQGAYLIYAELTDGKLKNVTRDEWTAGYRHSGVDPVMTIDGPVALGQAFRGKVPTDAGPRIVAGLVGQHMIRIDTDQGTRAGRVFVLRGQVLIPAADAPGAQPTLVGVKDVGAIRIPKYSTFTLNAGEQVESDPTRFRFRYELDKQAGIIEVQVNPDATFMLRTITGKAQIVDATPYTSATPTP